VQEDHIIYINLSIFYYHGVLGHILESWPREPSDDQKEGNSENLINLILIYKAILFSSTYKCREEFHRFMHSFKAYVLVFASHYI